MEIYQKLAESLDLHSLEEINAILLDPDRHPMFDPKTYAAGKYGELKRLQEQLSSRFEYVHHQFNVAQVHRGIWFLAGNHSDLMTQLSALCKRHQVVMEAFKDHAIALRRVLFRSYVTASLSSSHDISTAVAGNLPQSKGPRH